MSDIETERQAQRNPAADSAELRGPAHAQAPSAELEKTLGYAFTNRDHLSSALVHKSYLHEVPGFQLGSNERLEFLGDAVLGLIVSTDLFSSRPGEPEGELTALRGALVRKNTLARLAESIQLGLYLVMSRGEEAAGGRARQSNLASALEAVLGAVYIDGGLDAAAKVWHRVLGEESEEALREVLRADYKSRLQQVTQARLKVTPSYRLVGTRGPEHAKEFDVEVIAGDQPLASGSGRSKQLAEQAAAEAALRLLEPDLNEPLDGFIGNRPHAVGDMSDGGD